MIITRTHVLGWISLAIAATALLTTGRESEAKPEHAPVLMAAVKAEWLPAAGNLWKGTRLYFGQHDRVYRGQIVQFVDTPKGEAAVLIKDGNTEVMLRKDIAIRDFWVKAP